jgi:penicillin-binding protein 1A
LITLAILMAVLLVIGYLYVLNVYAPGLRTEARSIPQRVHAQLVAHGDQYVPLSGISPDLRNAIVAIEDRRFYIHPGVDPIGLVRALTVNASQQHVDQGGSTLEEQLAKRAIVGDDRSLHEKLRTLGLAWAIDQEFGKRYILEMYLNAAYYGRGAYGADAAAQVYFGTDAVHLTLAESAFLAAMPQAPSIYGAEPTSAVVTARWQTVLADMVNSQYITPQQAQAAEAAPLHFVFSTP